MAFAPGVSGNPRGRPRAGAALAEKIRELGGQDGAVYALELHRLATEHTSAKVRLMALGLLLDRGYGKPPQTIDIQEAPEAAPQDLSCLSFDEMTFLLTITAKVAAANSKTAATAVTADHIASGAR